MGLQQSQGSQERDSEGSKKDMESKNKNPEPSHGNCKAHNTDPKSHKCFPETSKCFPESHKFFPESHKCFPESKNKDFESHNGNPDLQQWQPNGPLDIQMPFGLSLIPLHKPVFAVANAILADRMPQTALEVRILRQE